MFFYDRRIFVFCERNGSSESECRKYFLKYIKRIFIILIIWLIPYFFVYDIWWIRQEGLPNGIFEYISNIFFGGKYFFLWYLVALLIGVTLAFLFYKKHVAGGVLSLLFLIIGMIGTSYFNGYLPDQIQYLFDLYISRFFTFRNGLFFGFPCIYLGMMIGKIRFKLRKPPMIIMLIIANVLFAIEFKSFRNFNDMQFSVLLLSAFLVINASFIILKMNTFWFRKLSFLIYVIHPLLIRIIQESLKMFPYLEYCWYLFWILQIPIIIMLSIAIGILIIKASKKVNILSKAF